MNILMVIGQYYPVGGGAERQCQIQSEELARRGHRVRVVTGNWKYIKLKAGYYSGWPSTPRIVNLQIMNGVEVVRITPLFSVFGIKKGASLSFCIQLFFYLLSILRKFDVVHMHQALRPAAFTMLALQFIKKPSLIKLGNCGERNDFLLMKYGEGFTQEYL